MRRLGQCRTVTTDVCTTMSGTRLTIVLYCTVPDTLCVGPFVSRACLLISMLLSAARPLPCDMAPSSGKLFVMPFIRVFLFLVVLLLPLVFVHDFDSMGFTMHDHASIFLRLCVWNASSCSTAAPFVAHCKMSFTCHSTGTSPRHLLCRLPHPLGGVAQQLDDSGTSTLAPGCSYPCSFEWTASICSIACCLHPSNDRWSPPYAPPWPSLPLSRGVWIPCLTLPCLTLGPSCWSPALRHLL